MTAGADPRSSDAPAPPGMPVTPPSKPRFALFIATACGLGNIPIAPGTWGSLAGLLLAVLPWWAAIAATEPMGSVWDLLLGRNTGWTVYPGTGGQIDGWLLLQCLLALLTSAIGVWSAGCASRFWAVKDPQRVVIDEVSGQHLTLVIGCAVPIWWRHAETVWTNVPLGLITSRSALSWKYLLLGLILFRVFDIWKPFPARQAESLPGGWGIMADDWVAGVYAAIGLWIARAAGL
ncbi:MAG TPA: phosphatidylglycerophosphatase A [Candidatus Acidoferrales bacterium]|nr:phosphatidylglycerophosphatase A [Candidatus Acidoferrales bacterium]